MKKYEFSFCLGLLTSLVQAGTSGKSEIGGRGSMGCSWVLMGGEPGVCRILETEAPERGARHLSGCLGTVARAGRDA
jgi:hypothetical protein